MQATGFTIKYSKDTLSLKNASVEEHFYNIDYENGKINVEWASLDEIDKTSMDFYFDTASTGAFSVEVESVTAFANGNLEIPENYNIEGAKALGSIILMGDVDEDGTVNNKDLNRLMKYLDGESVTISEVNSDVNLDGFVNFMDLEILIKLIDVPVALPVLYGDVNGDGEFDNKDLVRLQKFISNEIIPTRKEAFAADVVYDGVIDNYDLSALRFLASGDLTEIPLLYGDVNLDGIVNQSDVAEIKIIIENQGATNYNILAMRQLVERLADANLDGIIGMRDYEILQAYIHSEIDVLPYVENTQEEFDIQLIKKTDETNNIIYTGIQVANGPVSSLVFKNQYIVNPTNLEITLKNIAGETISNDDIVGTGTTIYVTADGNTENKGTVLIYGDCNGDGDINGVDALALIKHINKKILFTNDIFKKAGAIISNDYNKLTAVDALAIVKHATKKIPINQSK